MTTEATPHSETEAEALAREMAADLGFKHPTLPEGRPDVSSSSSVPSGVEGGPSPSGTQTGDPPSSPPSSQPEGSPPDLLANLKPEDVLRHPTLGPLLQSRIDSTVAQQTRVRVDRTLQEQLPALKAQAEDESLVEYLVSRTPDERATVLAEDQHAAVVWGKHLEREQAKANPSPDAVAYAGQVTAYKFIIQTTGRAVDESSLPDTLKAELRIPSQEEVNLKEEGLYRWQQRVNQALLKQATEASIAATLETRWEAYRNEQDAKSPKRPSVTVPGTQAQAIVNDPKVNTLTDMWDAALARSEASRS